MNRSLLQPRWLVAHVVILAVVITFPQLGMWQLRRHDEEQANRARLEQRLEEAPKVLEEALRSGTPEQLEFTPVTATGAYLDDETVHQRNRGFEGRNGFDVLTPLELGDGTIVLVRRGWVPPTRPSGSEPRDVSTPDGQVTVTGWLERSGQQPSFGPTDPVDGELTVVFHADLERLAPQLPGELAPMLLHLTDQSPAQPGELPAPQPAPSFDSSGNLSYAIQWFSFTVIAIVGYGIVLWRRSRGLDVDPVRAAE